MRLTSQLAARVPPDGAITNAVHRLVLASHAPRLAARRDRAGSAIARAQRTTTLGRFSAGERAWIDRIEARRRRMASEFSLPGVDQAAPGQASRDLWSPPYRWSMPRIWARFLMRLVGELAPGSCVELGTGFGISGMYQAAALEIIGAGTLQTLDCELSLIPIARRGFAELRLDHRIELTTGPIGQTLGGVADRVAPIDYVLIDAEHTEEATVANFDRLRPHLAPGAVVVVDDIFLSEGMRRAWETIRGWPGHEFTITLRRLGIVAVSSG